MRLGWIFAIVIPVAASQGCGDSGTTSAKGGCTKDTDCKGDRICVAGECVSESGDSGIAGGGGSSSNAGGANSAGTGGRSTASGGSTSGGGGARSTGGKAGAGGNSAGAGGSADSGTSGAAGAGGRASGGAGGADAGPECTQQDTSACAPGFPFPACCTRAGTCGTFIGALGCVTNAPTPDAGTGAGGTAGGGGLISTTCKTCRATSCDQELAACNANTACAALSSCIDGASPFTLLNCGITTVTQPVRTLYDALSTCASTSCTSCPSINL